MASKIKAAQKEKEKEEAPEKEAPPPMMLSVEALWSL